MPLNVTVHSPETGTFFFRVVLCRLCRRFRASSADFREKCACLRDLGRPGSLNMCLYALTDGVSGIFPLSRVRCAPSPATATSHHLVGRAAALVCVLFCFHARAGEDANQSRTKARALVQDCLETQRATDWVAYRATAEHRTSRGVGTVFRAGVDVYFRRRKAITFTNWHSHRTLNHV